MAHCQKCSAVLDGDFGVIHCGQCGEINFLDEGRNSTTPQSPPNDDNPTLQAPDWGPPLPVETAEPSPSAPEAGEVLKEIADFGNQLNTSSETGVLLYEVRISGIDTIELRKSLIEIIKEPKFKWDVEEIESKIHDGKLTISSLTPIKASVLIKKIRHLDLDIDWRQGNIYENPTA